MNKKLLDDAYTLANYMTMETLENELRDCIEAKKRGDTYTELDNVIKVIKKAVELCN